MKKHYIVTESWVKGIKNGSFMEPFIPKNSGIVVLSEINGKVRFYHQGHSVCSMDSETFHQIPKVGTSFNDDFISDYIIPDKNIKILKELISKLRKIYKEDKLITKVLNTLNTWIFSTKGSKAISGSEFEELDFNNLSWVNKNGFLTKPFSWNENRSGRTTSVPTEDDINNWCLNPKEVLPLGIRSIEHCTYGEMFRIGEKLFQEICGINGIDDKFKKIVKEFLPNVDENYVHNDYMTGEMINVVMFEKNTHHGKLKGLELCHKDPSLLYSTIAENITIGFSESNRKQSGNSIEDMGFNGINAMLIKMGKSPITKNKLNIILESI
jgi:hypothetical protein